MEKDYIIELLQEEIAQLRRKLAIQSMDQDINENEAEELFVELQQEINSLLIKLSAVQKSRDEFQLENSRLKRRIFFLEKTIKGLT